MMSTQRPCRRTTRSVRTTALHTRVDVELPTVPRSSHSCVRVLSVCSRVCVCPGDFLFVQAKEWGLRVYEQDWLDIEFLYNSAARTDVHVAQRWLDGLCGRRAAVAHGAGGHAA